MALPNKNTKNQEVEGESYIFSKKDIEIIQKKIKGESIGRRNSRYYSSIRPKIREIVYIWAPLSETLREKMILKKRMKKKKN